MNVKRISNKVNPDLCSRYYYRKNEESKKMERKRSFCHLLTLWSNKTHRILEELLSIDLTHRVMRFIVWKILPAFQEKHQYRIKHKFEALASRFMSDYYLSSLERTGRPVETVVIATPDGALVSYPKCFPRMVIHKQLWSTRVNPPIDSQTPL